MVTKRKIWIRRKNKQPSINGFDGFCFSRSSQKTGKPTLLKVFCGNFGRFCPLEELIHSGEQESRKKSDQKS